MIKKRLGLLIIILGVVFIILGFIYEGILAGIPYQDPTPELLQKYMHYVNIGQSLYKVGVPVIIAGLLIILLKKILKLPNKHK